MLPNPVYVPHQPVVMASSSVSIESAATVSESARWLLSYQGKSGQVVVSDPRFEHFLQASLPHYTVHWYSSYGKDHPLPTAIPHALSGFTDPVIVDSDHFVVISGAFGTEADFKGLLWVNTESEQPVAIFAFMMQNSIMASLDIYTNGSSPSIPLPPQFVSSLLKWKAQTGIRNFSLLTIHDAQNHTAQLSTSLLGGS